MKKTVSAAILLPLCLWLPSCSDQSGSKPPGKGDPQPRSTRPWVYETKDDIRYVPTWDSVAHPQIYNETVEPSVVDDTSVDEYAFGRPVRPGFARTTGPSVLTIPGKGSRNLPPGTNVEVVDAVPVSVDGKFFAKVRVSPELEGELPLGNIVFELAGSNQMTVGYIPRREVFSTVIDSTQHSLEGDKPIRLRLVKDVSYNNLVFLIDGHLTIIDGSYLSNFFARDALNLFGAFGVKECAMADYNNDGLTDIRITYEQLSSFSYMGISTGPSCFYFTVIGKEIRPMYAYNLEEGEDIDFTQNSIEFSDADGDGIKETIRKIQVENTENSVSVRVVVSRMEDHVYAEQNTVPVLDLKIPSTKTLENDLVSVRSKPSALSELVERLARGQQVEIKAVHYSSEEDGVKDHLWYQVASSDGWINGESLGFAAVE